MDEFKLQFKLHLIQGGSWKVNEGYGRKHYVARFTQGRFVVHHSAKSFKRAGDAIEYADKVLARYGGLFGEPRCSTNKLI